MQFGKTLLTAKLTLLAGLGSQGPVAINARRLSLLRKGNKDISMRFRLEKGINLPYTQSVGCGAAVKWDYGRAGRGIIMSSSQ